MTYCMKKKEIWKAELLEEIEEAKSFWHTHGQRGKEILLSMHKEDFDKQQMKVKKRDVESTIV